MFKKNKVNCVIVPIYKEFEKLNHQELLSLHQLYKKLGKHQILFFGPSEFNWTKYLDNARENCVIPVLKEFDKKYFHDINGYNKLLVSLDFYKSFKHYQYFLLYQLDAYVFRDELDFWCNEGYDYIGAPWTGFLEYKNAPLLGVGNGGFSLRNVRKSIRLVRKVRLFEVLYNYRYMNNISIIPRLPLILNKLIKAHKNESLFEKDYGYYEDIFWCKGVEERLNSTEFNSSILELMIRLLLYYDFKIAPVEIASRFSIELDPKKYFELNNRKLPFGCHAWEKYEPEFWKEFIPAHSIPVSK